MKIVVEGNRISYWPSTDYIAFDDSVFPDGPVAYGATPVEALRHLAEQYEDDAAAEAAIEAKIEELTEVVGVPV